MIKRPILLSVAVTIATGLYLTLDLVPSMSPVHDGLAGQAALYIKWDLENFLAGAAGCFATAEPVDCFFGLTEMFWGVSGLPLRFVIIVLGASMAAALSHRLESLSEL